MAEGLLPTFPNTCSRVRILFWHHQHLASGRLVFHWRYWPVPPWAGRRRLLARAMVGVRLLLLTGSALPPSPGPVPPPHFFPETPRLGFSSDLGRGKRLCLTRPRGSSIDPMCVRLVSMPTHQTRDHLFKHCYKWKDQQAAVWARVKEATKKGKQK